MDETVRAASRLGIGPPAGIDMTFLDNGRKRPLRIGMVTPPWFEIPPRAYGGIEWMVYWLVEGLVHRGHEVVLVAAGKNRTSAQFVQTYRLPPSARLGEPLPEVVHAAAAARALDGFELDVVHDHTLAGPLVALGRSIPTVVSAHGPVSGELGGYYANLGNSVSLVAISNAQRRSAPNLPWVATVYNSTPVREYPFRENKDDFTLFLGRMSPEKGVHLAIDAARQANVPLVIAGKCTEPEEHAYFEEQVAPRLGSDVEWLGEADTQTKKDLLSRARCLLFPIQWEEPFGIVMVEAMACGTPVVALAHGSVSEVVKHGTTGYICDNPTQIPAAIARCDAIYPAACRAWVAGKFDVATMVSGYERVYRNAIGRTIAAPIELTPAASSVADRAMPDPAPGNGDPEVQPQRSAMIGLRFPDELARRFEAVVFDWDGTAVHDRTADATQVRRLVEELCAHGMDVAIVTGTHMENVDDQLQARPHGPGHLYLLVNRGSEVFEVGMSGPASVYRRVASTEEERALDEAAARTIALLARRSLRTEIVSARLNRRKIDLIPEPEWVDPPKAQIAELLDAVAARLGAAGISGLSEVVELASREALSAGLPSPRVTSDAKHVEIGLTDKSDSARWILDALWRRGIGPELILIVGDEFGKLGGVPGSDSLLLVAQGVRAISVSVGVEPTGVPAGVLHLEGGPRTLESLLQDQLTRRLHGETPRMDPDPGWSIAVDGFNARLERVHEALLTVADARIGTSGHPPIPHRASRARVLASLYDDVGPESQLLSCPVWNTVWRSGTRTRGLRRVLDLHTGMLHTELGAGPATARAVVVSSLARPGIVMVRTETTGRLLDENTLLREPLKRSISDRGSKDGRAWMVVEAPPGGVAAAVKSEKPRHHNDLTSLDRLGAYRLATDSQPDIAEASKAVQDISKEGFEKLLVEHRAAWARRWEDADVRIEGDPDLQVAIRFALFHLMSSVADEGEAAVGARGLSGEAYRGHVFWDSDVFVLPFLAATHPAAARAMLEYRIRRLPAAKDAAARSGRKGARFPWESARDGYDVTPRSMRDWSGAIVPVRTGELEEHIVADVAWAADHYLAWTGDEEFAAGPGCDLLIETARYWASRIRLDDEGRGHIDRVIGPDEYHEEVDDNAFTNVMARWNLQRAANIAKRRADVDEEIERWLDLAGRLVDGYNPSTKVYEQFAGFFDLEPLLIKDEAPRRPIAADMLLGRERVQATQVVKQADVLMLHHLLPVEVPPGSLEPNLEYYEPRTSHGSSLSPGIHASLLARAGRLDDAVEALQLTSRIDLDDLTGTSAGGLHLAAMGSLWQAIAFGFIGLRPAPDVLDVDPRVPAQWRSVELTVSFRGSRVRLHAEPDRLHVTAEPPIRVRVAGAQPLPVGPEGREMPLTGRGKVVQT